MLFSLDFVLFPILRVGSYATSRLCPSFSIFIIAHALTLFFDSLQSPIYALHEKRYRTFQLKFSQCFFSFRLLHLRLDLFALILLCQMSFFSWLHALYAL